MFGELDVTKFQFSRLKVFPKHRFLRLLKIAVLVSFNVMSVLATFDPDETNPILIPTKILDLMLSYKMYKLVTVFSVGFKGNTTSFRRFFFIFFQSRRVDQEGLRKDLH